MKQIGHILLAVAVIGCLFCIFVVLAFHRAAVEHFNSTNEKLGQLERELGASKARCEALEKELQRIEAEQAAATPATEAPEPAVPPDLATKSFVEARLKDLRESLAAEMVAKRQLPKVGRPKFSESSMRLLIDRLGSDSERLRKHAYDTLLKCEDPALIPLLIDALAHDHLGRRSAALYILEQRTHQSFGYAPKAPAAQRQEAIAKWRAWWEKQPKDPAP